ncbi:non-specific serine,threonine protein kinase [Sarracenia purpurea var. burkii]
MNPKFFSTSNFLFAIIILVIADLPPSSGAQYLNCSQPFQCSGISNIRYPFWGGNRPEYCGHQSFQLNCSGEAPTITIQSRPYRVLAIDSATTTLTVVREEFWNNDCPQYLYNATLDTDHFNYVSGTENLILYYNCRDTAQTAITFPTQFACTANGTAGTFALYSTSGLTTNPNANNTSVQCATNVGIQVNQTAAALELAGNGGGNLIQVLNAGVGLLWTANNSACDQCLNSGGLCGSSTSSPNLFACYCADQPYPVTCNSNSSTNNGSRFSKRNRILIATALSVGVCMIVLGMVFLSFCLRKKLSTGKIQNLPIPFCKKKKSNIVQNLEAFLEECGSLAPKRYSYSDIKKMTDSFKDQLGNGGYGCVYKGKLRDGRLVAVKVLNESKGDGEEFANEVSSISKTSHVNVVKLVGFCFDRSKRALIYEFMPNGSLEKYIFEKKNQGEELITPLGWERTYNIAIGIAYGLEYLHHGCSTRILHLDIKPQNILLDQDFCPKISDFGLARLCLKRESKISMVGMRGTIGYIAPEVFSRNFGKVSYKSDVYSYGMLILDMVVGRKNIDAGSGGSSEMYFPHWIHKCLEMNEDLKLKWAANEREEEVARKMVLVALWCIQTDPTSRPSMNSVVGMLEGSHENIQVPPKPFSSIPLQRTPVPDSNTSSHSLLQESDDTIVSSKVCTNRTMNQSLSSKWSHSI